MAKLKRSLGLFPLIFFGIGMIIGAGIYSIIGAAAGKAEEGLWLSFLLAAFAALFTGLSYAELATAMPKTGVEFNALRHSLPRHAWLAATVGYVLVLSAAGTAATVALAFGGYLKLFADFPPWLAAAILLGLATLVNIAGIKQSAWFNIVFTLIEVAGLGLVIWLGFKPDEAAQVVASPLHAGILSGAALIFFVYLGFEDIANLAEEAVEPGRDLPKAILISLAVTTTLYVLVAIAVMVLSSPDALAGSDSPLAEAVRNASEKMATALGAIALAATANTALISLIVASRMLYAMARAKAAPRVFRAISPKRETPWLAGLAGLGLACLYLPLGKTEITGSLSSFGALLAFASVNGAVIILRRRQPDLKRPFKIPVSIGGVPVAPVLGLCSIGLLLSQFDGQVYLVGGCGLAAALVGHWLHTRLSGERPEPRDAASLAEDADSGSDVDDTQ